MKGRLVFTALVALAAAHADVYGLTPPSKSDGPVRLLNCVVSGGGILEAEVDSQTDDAMTCNIRCNYAIGEDTFSHWFNEAVIPARFSGRVGKFDTSGGKAGSYSGEIGSCRKTRGDR